jgi:ribosomal-protein-alanine N-acetyltransferase
MRSQRLVLRPPTLADEGEWLHRMRASRDYHRPWIKVSTTPEAYRAYVARGEPPHREFRIACRREDGAVTGFFNLSEIVRGNFQSAFLGYGGVAEFSGRGYMTEGLELVLREAFTELKLHRIEANIQPGNTASIALVARCGFVKEGFSERYLKIGGRWADHERWAIRSEQWKAR